MANETTDNNMISKLLLLADSPIEIKEATKPSRWSQMDPGDRATRSTQQIDPEERSKSMQNKDMRMVRGSVKARGSVAVENFVYNASGTVGIAYRKIAAERRDRYIREY